MNKLLHLIIILFLCTVSRNLLSQELYKDPDRTTDERIADLLSRMTTEEKIGQLCFPTGWEMYRKIDDHTAVPAESFIERMQKTPIGGFWATLRADPWTQKTLSNGLNPKLSAKALNSLQRFAVEETRLGIPLLFAEECMHGHMAIGTTVFPTGLGQGSTWNPQLIQEMAGVIALETRLQGAHIAYGPILDLARELRWSRVEETFGEDPVLTAKLGVAFVNGLQGNDFKDGRHVYSTPKHFAAYGIPSGGHNGQQAFIGERELFSNHLLPFGKVAEAGVKTIMTSYNSIDGIPATAHKYLLKDILRVEWGFDGFVFSDLGSIEGIAGTHRAAKSVKHAAALSLKAGVDADLGGNAYSKNLISALDEGLVSMSDIDNAVVNILRLKFEMGLFENPYVDTIKASQKVRNEKHIKLSREVARQGIVLLKNCNNILPLKKDIGSIAVIGPNADNIYNQLGDYTAPQERSNIVTVLDYYDKNTSDLLYQVPVPGVTGVTRVWRNIGAVRNKGFEAILGVDVIKTDDLLWTIDANIGLNRNKVTELYGQRDPQTGEVAPIILGDGVGIAGSANRILREGIDSDTWYIPEWAGVNPETGAPQWYRTVKNENGEEVREITEKYAQANQVEMGAYTPKFFGGFSTTLTYKQFDANMVFGYSVGGKIYNYTRAEYDSDGAYSDRNQMRLMPSWKRWEKPGDIATHPVASYNNPSLSNKVSSRYLEDGTYLKMRTLSLGYNFKLPQLSVENVRVFLTGENLFTITDYSGVDPEIPSYDGKVVGVTTTVYPSTRKFLLGFNLTF
jgi:beta-glucosidase-like glycosyl hydrolase